MYSPKHFEESRIEVMHDLIQGHPLATLITMSADGLNADHITLSIKIDGSPFGTLVGHVARSNPLLNNTSVEILVVFQGPNAYISPSWYATKNQTGKVVPTWNYAVVHAYGTLRVIDNPLWLRAQLETLTKQHETNFPKPWAVSDAPQEFTERLISSIIGIEIPITRLLGKWKVSQNQPPSNRAGVVTGLSTIDKQDAKSMATLVQLYGEQLK